MHVLWMIWALSHAAVPPTSLQGADGAKHVVPAKAPLTVVVFFARHCPIQRSHDERLIALATEYASRGVRFFAVDSEAGVTLDGAQAEVKERGYPFPLLIDPHGTFAHAVQARFATFTLVLDDKGEIRYQGGIDADKQRLRPESPFYLKDALDALLAGKPPKSAVTKALGCSLRFD